MTPEQDEALGHVEAARFDITTARQQLDETIRYAAAVGVPKTDIAAAAGLSRQGVYDILSRLG